MNLLPISRRPNAVLRVLDLFSGIGGFSLGLERAGGFKTVAFCEIEPYCRAVLKKHWPDVRCFDDIRKLCAADIERVDVICGGFPCQDISVAGKGAGLAGERSGLWREYARLVGEIRPKYVIVENVTALLGRGLGDVLGDLASCGYDAEWDCIPAGAIGAIHQRDRVWILAYPGEMRGARRFPKAFPKQPGFSWCKDVRRTEDIPHRPDLYPSMLCRGGDGIPSRVDRTGAVGNAVVPQIPEIIGKAIMRAEGMIE